MYPVGCKLQQTLYGLRWNVASSVLVGGRHQGLPGQAELQLRATRHKIYAQTSGLQLVHCGFVCMCYATYLVRAQLPCWSPTTFNSKLPSDTSAPHLGWADIFCHVQSLVSCILQAQTQLPWTQTTSQNAL